MYTIDLIRQITQQFRKYKLRTFLALFGILWGTFSIIMLMSLSQGFAEHQYQQLKSAANNFIVFYLNPTTKSFQGYPAGSTPKVSADTIMSLKNAIPAIEAISPIVDGSGKAIYAQSMDQRHSTQLMLLGISNDYPKIFGFKLVKNSHTFSKLNVKHNDKVVIINSSVKNTFYPHESALGKKILINQIPFTVTGVIDDNVSKAGNGNWGGSLAYIPYSTFQQLFGRQYLHNFALATYHLSDIPSVVHAIRNYFAIHYSIAPDDERGLGMYDSTQIYSFVNWFFTLIQAFFLACGALTLAVGGIGVANIMFLIIHQRAKEIGIRMAIGAKSQHIIFQVLLESSLIVILGGAIGFITAALTLLIMHYCHLPTWLGHPHMSWLTAFMTIGALMVVALLAGYFPARKAANMNPVEAINQRGGI